MLGDGASEIRVTEEELTAFISSSIPSVWGLELLLFLRARQSERWSKAALLKELRASHTLVQQSLATFEAVGLLRRDDEDRWRYEPATPLLDQLCAALEARYRERPLSVIEAIAKAPDDKLRSFADAFRIKGREP